MIALRQRLMRHPRLRAALWYASETAKLSLILIGFYAAFVITAVTA